MMRPGDERVLLTLYLDDSVRATFAEWLRDLWEEP